MDLFRLTQRLYECIQVSTPEFLQSVRAGLIRIADFCDLQEVHVVDGSLRYRLRSGSEVEHPTDPFRDDCITHERLQWLEFLAQDVLDARLSNEAYRAWVLGEPHPEALTGLTHTVHGHTNWLRPLFDFLDCHRRVSGPVGLYWLVPLLYSMYAPDLEWPITREGLQGCIVGEDLRDCPPEDPKTAVVGSSSHPRRLCEGLPRGCDVLWYDFASSTWQKYEALVDYITDHQCRVLPRLHPGEDLGSLRRIHGPRNLKALLFSTLDHLVVCTVGGTPVGTCTWSRRGPHNVHLECICSATDSGGGTLLIDHLKRQCERKACQLTADICEDMVDFFERNGLVRVQRDDNRFSWTPISAQHTSAPSHRERERDLTTRRPQKRSRCTT